VPPVVPFLDGAVGEQASGLGGPPDLGQLAQMHAMLKQMHDQLSSERQEAGERLMRLVTSPSVRPLELPNGACAFVCSCWSSTANFVALT
jgi:hypothetical protein